MRDEILSYVSSAIDDVKDARRKSSFSVNLRQDLAMQGCELAGLVDHGIPGSKTRSSIPECSVRERQPRLFCRIACIRERGSDLLFHLPSPRPRSHEQELAAVRDGPRTLYSHLNRVIPGSNTSTNSQSFFLGIDPGIFSQLDSLAIQSSSAYKISKNPSTSAPVTTSTVLVSENGFPVS